MNPMSKHIILGVHITNRVEHVADVQKTLTDFGCDIKTRLGLHEASDEFCSSSGMILLELLDDMDKKNELVNALRSIEGVEVQEMVFSHP